MSGVIALSLDDLEGHLVDPPIVDMLHFEPSIHSFVITFVPNEHVSRDSKEVVAVPRQTPEGERIALRLRLLTQRLAAGRKIERITHGGGGDFTFALEGGQTFRLSDDQLDSDTTLWTIMQLQDIAQAAEIAFRLASLHAA